MGDVGFHGGRHGGWEPLILPSPLSSRLHHFNLAMVVQAMGPAELQLRTSRQDSIHHTAGCRLTADRRPLADKAIGTMLDSLGSLTFELLYPQPHCFL